jgi:hypothetical protein
MEQSSKFLFGKEFFLEWLEKQTIPENLWALNDLAPTEMKLECMLWIINEMRNRKNHDT